MAGQLIQKTATRHIPYCYTSFILECAFFGLQPVDYGALDKSFHG